MAGPVLGENNSHGREQHPQQQQHRQHHQRKLARLLFLLPDERVRLVCMHGQPRRLLQEVAAGTPCLFLVALDGDELKAVTGRGRGGGAGGNARLWLLVAWIPDDSKVCNTSHTSLLSESVYSSLGTS